MGRCWFETLVKSFFVELLPSLYIHVAVVLSLTGSSNRLVAFKEVLF